MVVVTINYRLGTLGFMSIPDANITGNYGLQDQQMAMLWIQKYISYFGGDSTQVTLMGWSAGAASVSYHMYIKSSKNLFHRAIMMSGNMLNPWAMNTNSIKCTKALLKKMNIDITDTTNLKKILHNIKASRFIRKPTRDLIYIFFSVPNYCFVPTIDNDFIQGNAEEMVLRQKPINVVPILLGTTALELESDSTHAFKMKNIILPNHNETILFLLNRYLSNYLKQLDNGDTEFPCTNVSSSNVASLESSATNSNKFIRKLRTMADMYYGIQLFAKNYINMTNEKVFHYRFSFDGKFGNFKDKATAETSGAVHGDDLGYLFRDFFLHKSNDEQHAKRSGEYTSDIDELQQQPYDELDLKNEILVRKRMVKMWTNFIKFG